MVVVIDGPVGLRWRSVNVTNNARDQQKIIKLLAAIPEKEGGKKQTWTMPPAAGPDGHAPKELSEAIYAFQLFWKNKGVFKIIDGVVDPGMNTLRKLNELAPETPQPAVNFISLTPFGSPHDHNKCDSFLDSDDFQGKISHHGTPINPQRTGVMACIGGTNEVKYLGFENFVPDPQEDPSMPKAQVHSRRFTREIRSNTASDICFRSVPISRFMREKELKRIAMRGCRLTYASNRFTVIRLMPFLVTLGPVIQSAVVHKTPPADPLDPDGLNVVVVQMLNF